MHKTSVNPQKNILDEIVARKRKEVLLARHRTSVSALEESELFLRECYYMKDFILDPNRSGIIAEFKRKSPSKGVINSRDTVKQVTTAYNRAGASALSVLSDRYFFGGRKRDVTLARKANELPVLRKDFMLEEYQIIESKALGADIILLIAAILSPEKLRSLARLSKQLGMNVLMEVHNLEELERSICDDLDAIGVNNRNLGTFAVSLDHSFALAEHIPNQFLKISESGISEPETIKLLKDAGYHGFLIGENFMKTADPGKAMQQFVAEL